MKKIILVIMFSLITALFLTAQSQSEYITGTEVDLMMKVYIWGQVRSPGEFLVKDGTDLIGIISAAGGPTDYANLKKVRLIRVVDGKKEIIHIDLSKHIKSDDQIEIPKLQPGDIIIVPRSFRADWNVIIQVISQIAIIYNVIYLIGRD
ncbi:MAG: SLBB domain-containing protein [bacterium]|nr:SLBB domain-containing protein [bacterium]